MVLWLCLQIAKGEPVWGLPTEKGTVLYLCLEDSLNRIQGRVEALTDEVPDNIHFSIMSKTISSGLVKQIEEFLSEHPDTNVIAIDTLQRIRDTSGDLNAYANDYKDISLFKQITDRHGIVILFIYHLRKQSDGDPVNMVSGTTGLTGGADGFYILQKDSRHSRSAKLTVTGRDVEGAEYILEFDKAHVWNFISDDSDGKFSLSSDKTLGAVIDFIKTGRSFVGTASELDDKVNAAINPNILSRKLTQHKLELAEIGVIVKIHRTGAKRELMLTYLYTGDGDDDNDGKISSSPLSDSASSASLSS